MLRDNGIRRVGQRLRADFSAHANACRTQFARESLRHDFGDIGNRHAFRHDLRGRDFAAHP